LIRSRQVLAQGQLPALEMLEGVLLVFAGALLLTPGFFTDAVGFVFLVPPLRQVIIRWFLSKSEFQLRQFGDSPRSHRSAHHTIEGEYHRDDE
jgi:UPF0716 protein FxsA